MVRAAKPNITAGEGARVLAWGLALKNTRGLLARSYSSPVVSHCFVFFLLSLRFDITGGP